MKLLLKVLLWPVWAVWVRWAYFVSVLRAVDVELDDEMISGVVEDTDLEVVILRHKIRHRWGWNPPAAVENFLQGLATKRALELEAKSSSQD